MTEYKSANVLSGHHVYLDYRDKKESFDKTGSVLAERS